MYLNKGVVLMKKYLKIMFCLVVILVSINSAVSAATFEDCKKSDW